MAGYENVIFDLDGTLTDSQNGIVNSLRFALSRFGIDEADREALVAFIGPPLHESFHKQYGFSYEDAGRAVAHYREYFAEKGIYENELYPGIDTLLEGLSERGAAMMIATTKPGVYAEKIVEHFSIGGYFLTIRGSNLDGTMTEKGELIGSLVRDHSLRPGKTVMVGDRMHDILGARANGIDSIGVEYGYGSREELQEAGPTHLCRTVDDLASFFGLSSRKRGGAHGEMVHTVEEVIK